MLVALFTLILLGGGGNDSKVFDKVHRNLIEQVVVDDERSAVVLAEMKAAQKELDQTSKQLREVVKRWGQLDADKGADREALEPLLGEAREIQLDAAQAFVDSVFEMRSQLTEEEWGEVQRELDAARRMAAND